jgi:site-specific DNA-cytosine methylase
MRKKRELKGIEFFAGCSVITKEFINTGHTCLSLDNVQHRQERKIDYLIDFLVFDYKSFNKKEIDFLYFGFPCNTFSKASGGLHWEKNKILTINALDAYLMFLRMVEIINYFSNAVFYIENPSGSICSKKFFLDWVNTNKYYIYTISMSSFGFSTQKKTNIITNSSVLLISPDTRRVNGRYSKNKIENLSLKKRQKYTPFFAKFIVSNFIKNF